MLDIYMEFIGNEEIKVTELKHEFEFSITNKDCETVYRVKATDLARIRDEINHALKTRKAGETKLREAADYENKSYPS